MKRWQKAGIIVAAIIVLFYLIFLLVLPNVINPNNYKGLIQDAVSQSLNAKLETGNLKLTTKLPLSVGAKINQTTFGCDSIPEAIKAEEISATIDIFPLIFKTIKINNIDIKAVSVNSDITKDGKFLIEQCFIPKNTKDNNSENSSANNLKISDKLPKVTILDGNVNLKDLSSKNNLTLNIENLVFDKAVLNKHFRVATTGKVLVNNNENINFNIKLNSFMPELSASKEETPNTQTPYFNFIKELEKYNLKATVNTDLKITGKLDDIYLKGFANIDGLTFKINGKELPESLLHTTFTHKKGELVGQFFVSDKEKFDINAQIKKSKHPDIILALKTEKLSFPNIQNLAVAILETLNIKNDFNTFKTDGYITADCKLKTDMKKFLSGGNFKVVNGKISAPNAGLNITKITTDIDLSDNNMQIKTASALINGVLLEAKGKIDSKATADISVFSNNLPIAKLVESFLTGDLKKSYSIQNGILDFTASIKGSLSDIKPEITANLMNLSILDKINKINLTNNSIKANIKTEKDSFNGNITLSGTKAKLNTMNLTALAPEIKIDLTPDTVTISQAKLTVNNSAATLAGSIKNYAKKPEINVTMDGTISSNDVKNLCPKDAKSMVTAKGHLPFKAQITGKDDFSAILQILANANNNVTVANISKLNEKTTVINTNVLYKGNELAINDIGVYQAKVTSLGNNLPNNIDTALPLLNVTGNVIMDKTPILKNIRLLTNDNIALSVLGMNGNLRADITANGSVNSPAIKGMVNLTNLNMPQYLIKGQLVNLNMGVTGITADILGLDINGNNMDIKLNTPSRISMPLQINSLQLTSNNLDLDKLLAATAKMSQPSGASTAVATTSNAQAVPVNIMKGNANITKFKLSTIEASNISTPFTLKNDLLKLTNITANAYKGELSGTMDYNLKTLLMKADLKGGNMDANSAFTAFLGIKDQLKGTLGFNANITLKGATLTQQLKSLKGKADFEITDGQMGSLGKFETYLKAANIASSKILNTGINAIISAILPYNSGQIAYAKGNLTFSDGYMNFNPINTSGKEMALHITGNLNMLNYNAKITILGKLNQNIVDLLGPVGEISADKLVSYIPKVGSLASSLLKAFNASASNADLNSIPALTPKANSKAFKVVISGNTMNIATAVRSFQWIASEQVINSTEKSISNKLNIPTTKQELIQQVQTNVQTQIENQLQKSGMSDKSIQTLKQFGDAFLKPTTTPKTTTGN